MSQIYLHKTCRACKGRLEEFLNLGSLKLNAFPATRYELEQIQAVPLILTCCIECGLVQLDRTVPQDWLYRQYWYRSAVNETMVAELRDVVREATELIPVGAGDVVLDIGANDGTLLATYSGRAEVGDDGIPYRIAVEPAVNLQEDLHVHCAFPINDYFPPRNGELDSFAGKVKILTAIACAYDAEDPLRFFQVIHDLLAPKGVAVIQFQDLAEQIHARAFDNICHEHLEYYTLWSLSGICRQAGLTLFRCRPRAINGGSLRVLLRRVEDGIFPEQSVATQLIHEDQVGLSTPQLRERRWGGLQRFRTGIEQAKVQIQAIVQQTLDEGRVIDLYGASTKGNVLLQVLGIGPEAVRQAIDRSSHKWGRLTLTGIPIVGEEAAKQEPADVWFTPIWQFKDFVLERERWYLTQGGTVVFPLPRVEVVKARWKAGADA